MDVLIDASAMKSKNNAVQKYGRGVRMQSEKKGLIYIDISDKGNRFEKAAKSRITALRKIGVPVYKTDANKPPDWILDTAEKKLEELTDATAG